MKKLSKTELGFLFTFIMAVITTIAAIVLSACNITVDGMTTLAGSWIGALVVYIGFYCWKEKAANKQKHGLRYVENFIKDHNPEQIEGAARLLEVMYSHE